MNYIDSFYSILHETQFFNNFFYQQFILDLESMIAYDLQNHNHYPLPSFLENHSISLEDIPNTEFIMHHNTVIMMPKHLPQYRVVLKVNTALTFFKSSPTLLLSNSHIPIHQNHDLTKFLKPSISQNNYIIFFDFLMNQNPEHPETKNYIFQTITEVFKKEISYLRQYDYHHYYIIIKNTAEMQIYDYCKMVQQHFQSHSRIYVHPHFLLVECHNFYYFDNILYKVKHRFTNLLFDEKTLVIKEKVDSL